MDNTLAHKIQQDLPKIREKQIVETLKMLDEGDTVPFIARYRKERTSNLDEVQIRDIQDAAHRIQTLDKRKQEVIKIIDEQNALTPELKKQIEAASVLQQVEDLYLPYKQKRRTKATIAKEHGLEPLAKSAMSFAPDLKQQAAQYVDPDKELPDVDAVFAGVHEIIAEDAGDRADFREWVRQNTQQYGQLVVKVKRGGKELDEEGTYQQYYDFNQPIKSIPSFRTLAINRGEKEKVLSVKIEVNEAPIMWHLKANTVGSHQGFAADVVTDAIEDAYHRFIGPAIEREIRKQLTEVAADHAIDIFGKNLYNLLMQAPLKGKIVMGFDPAYRTGCKLAVVDQNGKYLDKTVIYPHKPASEAKRKAAKGLFIDFINQNHVEMIAIGNGTASRESEQFVADAIKEIKTPIYYVIVNEAGASVYSASQVARDEFPDFSVEQRSAVSIARRIQDPLAELVKIDPQAIGVGQYQHDVPQKQLGEQLDTVVETAVNRVGVNLNTASPDLLVHISGLTKTTSGNIVKFRNENGEFSARSDLKQVPRLGPKAFEQSVGFLRIIGGKNPLDNTDIHPESYSAAKSLLKKHGLTINQLGEPAVSSALSQLNLAQEVESIGVGVATLKDIIKGLETPGRDLRDEMPAPLLRKDVLTMEDLKPGMKLQGTVRNVVDFGVFVDIGVKQDGLVHISKMSRTFVKDPSKVASVGDIVTVWIDSVDLDRHRIQLTMVDPEG
ncbi:Tex family protein [Lentilactobacillus buchneri]|uniref:Transcriptional accessory protein n=1 Tax=Lentilactobacillus buchneri subsp. silagei CD034 TaxID=1071400 RepID=J9W4K1_LENBU|nr:Tex family protein [Lentilactobacillus buchneri]MCC6099965.1 RNA-binding transcriptional accessory protein [Lactobacillus sp.]AFS00572.1 Transcriptional accessory protein [Lentilactobacillus buchneri subsp. silagei CD034]MCT3542677.1 RNA-binding transcriptional accessory protein [Lentilactobacillus buchneri]MCT3544713.1 RNA-binding transcriptional accessory protein [Lentilactobacillus buchneri]MCT3552379.1 RNA-binding transcriptional accessory protein [Lentilactobacillus buchneri]